MATHSIARPARAIRGVDLSAVTIGLTVVGGILMGIYVAYASGIPRMIAATLADYIALVTL